MRCSPVARASSDDTVGIARQGDVPMTKRVVVVGAGIVGLWIAYELRRRELDVVVIDKAELGSGSSFGNAGWVIPARALPLPAPGLHWEGLKMMVQPDSPLYIKPTALPQIGRASCRDRGEVRVR